MTNLSYSDYKVPDPNKTNDLTAPTVKPKPPKHFEDYVKSNYWYNPNDLREKYNKFKTANINTYDFSELDDYTADGLTEQAAGLGISALEGLTWNAVESDYEVGHPATQFAGNLIGSMFSGYRVYKTFGAPIAEAVYRNPYAKVIARKLGMNTPIRGKGALVGAQRIVDQVRKLKLPMSPKNIRRTQAMVGLSVPEALVGGIADGIREESFGEALSSMPLWFLYGVLGNTGIKQLEVLYRSRRGKKRTRKSAELNYKGAEVEPNDADQITKEVSAIFEDSFQSSTGLTMGEFDKVINDFSHDEVDELLNLIYKISEPEEGTTASLKAPLIGWVSNRAKRREIQDIINKTYTKISLRTPSTKQSASDLLESQTKLVDDELKQAARDDGVARSVSSAVSVAPKSKNVTQFLENKGLLPATLADMKGLKPREGFFDKEAKKWIEGEAYDKSIDWTQVPETPYHLYGDEGSVIKNKHNEYVLDDEGSPVSLLDRNPDLDDPRSRASLEVLYGKEGSVPIAVNYMLDLMDNDPELRQAYWRAIMESGEGNPSSKPWHQSGVFNDYESLTTPPTDKSKYIDPWRIFRGQLTKKQLKEMEEKIGPFAPDDKPELVLDTDILQDKGEEGFVGYLADFEEAKKAWDARLEKEFRVKFSDWIDTQRPMVEESKVVATLENKDPVTVLEDGSVVKGTPEDYRLKLKDEIKDVMNINTAEDMEITGDFGPALGSMRRVLRESKEVSALELASRWLSNVNPVFNKHDSYFKNIRLRTTDDYVFDANNVAYENKNLYVINGDGQNSIGVGFEFGEPFLLIDKDKLMVEYKLLKSKKNDQTYNTNSFDEYMNERISSFYGSLKRNDLDKLQETNYQKDTTEAVNLNKPVTDTDPSGELILHNNVKVIDDPNSPKAGTYNRSSQEITINSELIEKKFYDKAWTTPYIKGVRAFNKDAFETLEQWRDFILEHEYLHHEFSFEDFKKTWTGMSQKIFDKPAVDPTKADYENFINSSAYLKVTGKEFGMPKDMIEALREVLGLSKEHDQLVKELGEDGIDLSSLVTEGTKGKGKTPDDMELLGLSGKDFDDLFDLPFKHSESDRRAFEAGVLPDNLDLNAPADDLIKIKIVEQIKILAKLDKSVFDESQISKDLTNAEALYLTDVLHERIATTEDITVDAMLDYLDEIALRGTKIGNLDDAKKADLDLEGGATQADQGRAVSADPDKEVVEGAVVLKDELDEQATEWFGYDMEFLMGPDKEFGLSKNIYIRDMLVRYAQSEQNVMSALQEGLLNKYFEIRKLLGAPTRSSIRNQFDKVSVLFGRENATNKADQRLYKLAKYLDQDYTEAGNPLAKIPDELKADPKMYQAFILYRELMDDIANLLRLPKDKRITGYLAHIFSGKAGRLVGGRVLHQTGGNTSLKELLESLNDTIKTEGRSLDEVLDALEVTIGQGLQGTGYRGLIKRKGDSDNYTYNLDDITLAVIYGSTQKEFTHKLAKRANDVLANLPYVVKDKLGAMKENPIRKSLARYVRHMMGKGTSRREYIAQLYSDSEVFNRGVDRLVEWIGGAPKGLNLSMPKNAVQSDIDNEMRKKAIEWLDALEIVARSTNIKTGKPTGNLSKSPSKFIRANIALQIQDLRNALMNRHLAGPVANSIYRGMIVGKLGLNLSHAMLNLTQIINTAAKLELNYVKDGVIDALYKKTPIHGKSIQSLIDESGIKRDVTSTEEFMGMRPSFLKDLQETLLAWSRKTETFNREVALLGAYRKFRDKNLSHSEALTKARLIVNETQHTFDRSGTPPFLRGPMMRLLMMFSSYTVHQTAFTVSLAKDFKKGWHNLDEKTIRNLYKDEDTRGMMMFFTGTAGLMAGAWGSDETFGTNMLGKVMPPMISLPYNIAIDTPRRGLAGSVVENVQGPAGDLSTHLISGTAEGVEYVYWMLNNHSLNARDSSRKMWSNYSKVGTAFIPASAKKVYNWDEYSLGEMAGLKHMKRKKKPQPIFMKKLGSSSR